MKRMNLNHISRSSNPLHIDRSSPIQIFSFKIIFLVKGRFDKVKNDWSECGVIDNDSDLDLQMQRLNYCFHRIYNVMVSICLSFLHIKMMPKLVTDSFLSTEPTTMLYNKQNQSKTKRTKLNRIASKVDDIKFAQTHIVAPEGKKWINKNDNVEVNLHLVGGRDTLLMVKYSGVVALPKNRLPSIKVINQKYTKELYLNDPSQFPASLDNQINPMEQLNSYYTVLIPRDLIANGVKIVVSSHPSGSISPRIGRNGMFKVLTIPMFLFGAAPSLIAGGAIKEVRSYRPSGIEEMTLESLPVSEMEFQSRFKLTWPVHVKIPSNGNQAQLISSFETEPMDFLKSMTPFFVELRRALGFRNSDTFLHIPIIANRKTGEQVQISMGIEIDNVMCTLNYSDPYVFLHELAHAMGAKHYSGDSPYHEYLEGSSWGYNSRINKFIPNYIDHEDDHFYCQNGSDGKCYLYDIMNSIGNNGAKVMFSDYEIGVIQNNLEMEEVNKRYMHYENGNYYKYNNEKVGYEKYIYNDENGRYLDGGLPLAANRDRPVYAIVITHNTGSFSACGQDCNKIFPLVKIESGHLLRYIDPSDRKQLEMVNPDLNGEYRSYCVESGCDYTLVATYSDGTTIKKLLQRGIRAFNNPSGQVQQTYCDPYNPTSIHFIVETIPADKPLSQIELYWTPYGFRNLFDKDSSDLIISQKF
ncbi:hypothetical protein PPL_01264 [Heterostelium album PN500]|uniref:Peptidase M66 domain-containing protein n=1 Tax=Heterostelium pallidum (strain ATCC 26659 / Pp 5 / PN500) TaxID=670386 RepID=D3AYK4_HETP5|nr:hypothetical protein PPL_01264 [Heterostelium album PN500]EFA86031.1 hypothetical protein PPL_01264 [Heterostelium album PN500]|eukprot:XP_020438137.1 hypothetical protein PPL_01264 [Heterostelium album PN500]